MILRYAFRAGPYSVRTATVHLVSWCGRWCGRGRHQRCHHGANANRKKSSPDAWQVHLLDVRAALALLRVVEAYDLRKGFLWLGYVAYGCSAHLEKCEKCEKCDHLNRDHFNRARPGVLDSPRSYTHNSVISMQFSAGTATRPLGRMGGMGGEGVWGSMG